MLFNLWETYSDSSPLAVLGLPIPDITTHEDAAVRALLDYVQEGFSVQPVRRLQALGLTLAQLAQATGISERTLKRRLSGKERFDVVESDRLLRFASIISDVASELSLKVSEATTWLATEERLALCATEPGIYQLGNLIGEEKKLREAQAILRKREAAKRPERKRTSSPAGKKKR